MVHGRFMRTLATLLTPATCLLLSTQLVQAAPQPAPSYSIRGAVSRIASPQVYAATPGAKFFDVSRVPLVISQPVYYVVHAAVVDSVYQYQYELVAAHRTVVGSVELAVNLSTHTQLIEVGTPTAASMAAADRSSPTSGQSATQSIVGQSPATQLAAATSSTSGYYHTVWVDSGIRWVTEVKDSISFGYDGTYVNWYSGSDYRWWGPGWSESQHSIGSGYNSNYTTATVWTHDHFGSSAYCWPSYNEIYYSNNNVVGYGSGAVGGRVSTSADGACAWALSHWSEVSGGA